MIWRVKWFEPPPNTLQLDWSEWGILNSTTPPHPKNPKQPTSLSSTLKSFFRCQNYDLWDCCNLHCAHESYVVVYEYWLGFRRCIWWFWTIVHSPLVLWRTFSVSIRHIIEKFKKINFQLQQSSLIELRMRRKDLGIE